MGAELAQHRIFQELPSRHKNQSSKKPPPLYDVFGRRINALPGELVVVQLYELCPPGAICGRLPIFDDSAFTISIVDHGTTGKFIKKHPLWNKQIGITPRPHDTARLVAKSAYGWLIQSFGYGAFDPLIPKILIGDTSPQQLVGCRKKISDDASTGVFSAYAIKSNEDLYILMVDYKFYGEETDFTFQILCGFLDGNDEKHMEFLRQFTPEAPPSSGATPLIDAVATVKNLDRIGLRPRRNGAR